MNTFNRSHVFSYVAYHRIEIWWKSSEVMKGALDMYNIIPQLFSKKKKKKKEEKKKDFYAIRSVGMGNDWIVSSTI